MSAMQEFMALSVSERLLLLQELWENINHDEIELSDAQKKELDHRLDQMNSGAMKFSSWEEARKKIRSNI